MNSQNHYADEVLDRVAQFRRDDAWVTAQYAAEQTMVIPVWRSRSLIEQGAEPRGVMMSIAETRALMETATTTVLLGVRNEVAHFAIDISPMEAHEVNELRADGEFVDLRSVGAVLDRTEASILAYAKGIMHWHSRHLFCGVCGSPTESQDAGHLRKCLNQNCSAGHFPRTDPAVIMLVQKDDRTLLGRKAEWMPGMYSTLAGFVEPGESLEQAVAREVMEESGVEITNIRYHSSQPWPFPSSLMLGFFADAVTEKLIPWDDELEDLQWFTRQDLADGGAGIAQRPRSDSIARRLIDEWIRQG
ncbi:MAG: NAD(+) diphosphatase [Alphaproteobacteria bacterium]|nr:NAD(+) diphosphatase [Alphaproteobacteria bacterium]